MDNNLQRTLEVFVEAGFSNDVDSRNAVFQWMQTTNELGTKTSPQRLLVLRHLAKAGFRFPGLSAEQRTSLFDHGMFRSDVIGSESSQYVDDFLLVFRTLWGLPNPL